MTDKVLAKHSRRPKLLGELRYVPTLTILGALREVMRIGRLFMTERDVEDAWDELERRAMDATPIDVQTITRAVQTITRAPTQIACCIHCRRDFTDWERIFVVMHVAQCWAESEADSRG